MDYRKESLRLHGEWKGKLEVISTVPVTNKQELSLAYTPGVAEPCLAIQKDVDMSYQLTRRWNLVAVVTDGTAVLGLGDIGPEAGMPVMENAYCSRHSRCGCLPLHTRPKAWMRSTYGEAACGSFGSSIWRYPHPGALR